MSIDFVYNTDFELSNKEHVSDWVLRVVNSKGYKIGNIVYAFFNDEDIKKLNIRFLNHDYYTDVISLMKPPTKLFQGILPFLLTGLKKTQPRLV